MSTQGNTAVDFSPSGDAYSARRLFWILLVSIFSCEFLVMHLLETLPGLSTFSQDMLDATLLVVLIFPILYFFLLRPTMLRMATLRQEHEALAESEARFRCLSAMSSDFFWVSDAEHRLTTRTETKGDPHLEAWLKTSLIGKRRWETPYLAPDESGWRAHQDILDAHMPFRDFAISRPKDNGSVAHINVSGDPVFDDAGRFRGYRGIGTDVTERRTAEVELQAAVVAAEAASVAKSRFLATMSHEIRTPMNGILGMAQVLLMPDVSESERLVYTRTILDSGQIMLTLLTDILDLSRIEAGKVELEVIAMDPQDVVSETRSLFAVNARSKGLALESGWSGPPRHYLSDPNRLRQMLSNLVGNAIKFTAQGQIRIEAREVELEGQTAVLEFSVADSGIGISEEQQSLLFQRFSQADSSITRNYGGSGLGLSIVAQLAALMGGGVGVESEAGRGARFWFRIRAELAPENKVLSPAAAEGREYAFVTPYSSPDTFH